MTEHNIQSVWQGQPTEPMKLSLEELRARAGTFQRTIRSRNLREYLAGALVMGFFGWHASSADTTLERIAHVLIMVGVLFVLLRLSAKGGHLPAPQTAVAQTLLGFHRQELQRQRDLLRGAWKWYVLPMVPGPMLLIVARSLELARTQPSRLPILGTAAAVIALVFIGVAWINRVGARKLDEELRRLRELDGA